MSDADGRRPMGDVFVRVVVALGPLAACSSTSGRRAGIPRNAGSAWPTPGAPDGAGNTRPGYLRRVLHQDERKDALAPSFASLGCVIRPRSLA